MATYSIYEAKTNLSKLLKKVARGEQVTFGPRGEPVFVIKYANESRRKSNRSAFLKLFGSMKGKFGNYDELFQKQADDEIAELFYNAVNNENKK